MSPLEVGLLIFAYGAAGYVVLLFAAGAVIAIARDVEARRRARNGGHQ